MLTNKRGKKGNREREIAITFLSLFLFFQQKIKMVIITKYINTLRLFMFLFGQTYFKQKANRKHVDQIEFLCALNSTILIKIITDLMI